MFFLDVFFLFLEKELSVKTWNSIKSSLCNLIGRPDRSSVRPRPYHTGEILNGVFFFAVITHLMFEFSVHTTPEKIENATITFYFGFVFEGRTGYLKIRLDSCLLHNEVCLEYSG